MRSTNICKSVSINATKEQVWHALFDDKNYKVWASIFQAGSYAQTDWSLGSKIVFFDKSGFGLLGEVIESRPYEALSVKYSGFMEEEGEKALSIDLEVVTGSVESYKLSTLDGATRLEVCADLLPTYYEDMCNNWDEALLKIKSLAEQKLMFTYKFKTPRERVFKAWTDPHQLRQWFRPPNYEIERCEVDLQPGGAFKVLMKAPDGTLAPTKGEYVEIVFPDRLVYYDSWDDDRPDNPQLLTTVLFEPLTEGSMLSLFTVFESETQREQILATGILDGWMLFMKQLEHYLNQS